MNEENKKYITKFPVFEREVNYYETDMMKIVHHSNYVRCFEEARTYLLDFLGYSYARIESEGFMIPVLSVSCEYKKPCRFGEKLKVIAKIDSYNGVRMKIIYEVWNEDLTELRVKGSSSHCFVDKNFNPVIIKKTVPELHRIFEIAKRIGDKIDLI